MVRFLEFMKENMRKEDLKNKIRYYRFCLQPKSYKERKQVTYQGPLTVTYTPCMTGDLFSSLRYTDPTRSASSSHYYTNVRTAAF